jgi:hypothetical protein
MLLPVGVLGAVFLLQLMLIEHLFHHYRHYHLGLHDTEEVYHGPRRFP